MPNTKLKRPAPLSLRLCTQERAKLEQWAHEAGISLSAYMKWCMFGRDNLTPPPRARLRNPTKDQKALANLLGILGTSRLASNVNQLARAANTGSLAVNIETENAIKRACDAIEEIRLLLLQALGLKA